jgi:hypothetical protein
MDATAKLAARKIVGARLRAARIAAGFGSAAEASRALGMPKITYQQHENGTRGFSSIQLDRYLAFFTAERERE